MSLSSEGVALSGRTDFVSDVAEYLQRTPRQLPSRYFYDALGSALFDAICRLPWYRVTRAETALLHFSPAECRALTQHGLGLLDRAPAGSARDAAEIALATLSGVATSHLSGFSSNEAKGMLVRAHALLGQAPQHRLRGLLLHSLGITTIRGLPVEDRIGTDHTWSAVKKKMLQRP